MKTEKELQKIGEEVVEVICEIYDPEIPVNIYALGLIYDVEVSDVDFINGLLTVRLNKIVPEHQKRKVYKIS